jgi:hypothetical protein
VITTKVITQEEYDTLPGTGAAAILNSIGEDGQPILKHAQCKDKNGILGITRYWADENGKRWKQTFRFVAGNEY